MRVDAIVNTTNEDMIGYSGVDLAIHVAAGRELDEECEKLAPLGLGTAKITRGYGLPCKYVIHTSGPIWQGGLVGESIILRSCYIESLKLAKEYGCESVAFPLISSGTYGYPKDKVLKFAIQTITEFLFENEITVYICVFDKESYSFSKRLFKDIKEFIDDNGEELKETSYSVRRHFSCDRLYAPREEEFSTACAAADAIPSGQSLAEYLRTMDCGFREMLFELIDKSGMTDVECYKRANVDKRTFSKIKSKDDYRPSKETAIAFAISLKLDMETTQELLATLGYTLSKSRIFDKIIMYFILNNIYDIYEINEALFEFDQTLLGNVGDF